VKFDGGILNVVINEFLENSEELPEVEYYDKDGNVTRYEAGDGDPVESEFKVIEISAIEDITVEFGGELVLPKTVKATLDNEEATEVTLAIEWAENEEFDAEVAGDYTFTGTLSKVEGEEVEFTIPEDKATVTVKVTVEEEVVEALRVESVSAIDETGVTVVFDKAFEKDTDDVTVEVLDNKGNVVEVEAVTVAEGEKEVQFTFVKEQKDQEGVWTIGGVEYDFDLAANLKAFRDADTQIKLNEALKDLGIKNVKVDNIPTYLTEKQVFLNEIDDEDNDKELTVEAIQEWVNKINAEELTAEEEAEIVKEVVKAKNNSVALLNILETNFERVNPEWIDGYEYHLAGITEASSFDYVQSRINLVNNNRVAGIEDIQNKVDKKELLKQKDLLEKYATPVLDGDKKGEQTEDTKKALKAIEIQLAVIEVTEATTPNRLKSALTKLDGLVEKTEKFMAKDGDYKGYVDAYSKIYFEVDNDNNQTADFKEIKNVSDAKTLITKGNETGDAQAADKDLKVAEEAIKALPEVDKLTVEDREAVEAARKLVDDLADGKTPSNLEKLEAAETAMGTLKLKAGIVSNRDELDIVLTEDAYKDIKVITLEDGNYANDSEKDKEVLFGLEITREVTLKAENKHKAILGKVRISSDNVTIDGVTINFIDFHNVEDITITNNVVTGNLYSTAIGAAGYTKSGAATITGNQVLNGSIGLHTTKTFDNFTITGNTIEKVDEEKHGAEGVVEREGIWIAFDEVIMTVDEADNIAEQLVKDNTFGTYFDDTEDEDVDVNKVKVQYKAGSDTVMRYAN